MKPNIEIERRFLPQSSKLGKQFFRRIGITPTLIQQGYLAIDEGNVFRVRITDDGLLKTAWQCFKAGRTAIGTPEYQQEISLITAGEMIKHCRQREIIKQRFHVPHEAVVFEVDVFIGSLEPLVLIEMELASPNQQVSLPEWIGEEVTDRFEYSNALLATNGLPKHFHKWLHRQS